MKRHPYSPLALAVLGALALPLHAWAAPAPRGVTTLAPVDADHVIVPGESIGPVHLGVDEDDVLARLGGNPDDSKAFDADHHYSYWQQKGIIVGFEKDRVVMIGTTSKDYATAGGIRVGTPGEAALEYFPSLSDSKVAGLYGLTDDSLGINFLKHPVDKKGHVLPSYVLPEGWTIDEINVFQSSDPVVLDRQPATGSVAPEATQVSPGSSDKVK